VTTTLRESRPVARKSHMCDLCFDTILAGQRYGRQTNIYDDRIYDFLTCEPCSAVFSAAYTWAEDYCDDAGLGPDEAEEWAREFSADDPVAIAYLARREAAWDRHRAARRGAS